MEVSEFIRIYKDKNFYQFNKMMHKYSSESFQSVIDTLARYYYSTLPLLDFKEQPLYYNPTYVPVPYSCMRSLFSHKQVDQTQLETTVAEETLHSLYIEQVHTSSEEIQKLLHQKTYHNQKERAILGMRNGLAFIADQSNTISEENLAKLYAVCMGENMNQTSASLTIIVMMKCML